MSKKRRTKREKLIAGTRRIITQNPNGVYSLTSTDNISSNNAPTKAVSISTYAYTYVLADSQKTLFIISILLLTNILLSFLLQKHLLRFPFFGF